MKYNKVEQRAIDNLFLLAENLKLGKKTNLDYGDICNLKNVLGIDLMSVTKSKTEMTNDKDSRFVNKKDDLLMTINCRSSTGQQIERQCFFNFQYTQKKLPKDVIC